MRPLSFLVFGLLTVLSTACVFEAAPAAEETTEALYARWAAQYEHDRGYVKADEQNPLFLELLSRKDSDVLFLRGMHAVSDPVRRLSRVALGTLKTDRSFEALTRQCHDKNMFVRERAMEALQAFREPRCVPHLLELLKNDPGPQVRWRVAEVLEFFPEERVKAALLEAMKTDAPVARTAASALGGLRANEAIEPTYRLFLAANDSRQEYFLAALGRHHHKKAVVLLIDIRDKRFREDIADLFGERTPLLLAMIESALRGYAMKTTRVIGPVPETAEQWKDWWAKAEPLFNENMELKKMPQPAPVRPEELGSDASQLEFRTSLDAKTYRFGDPIAIDFSMHNRSPTPLRTIPPVTSGWWPTMAYGIRLERHGKTWEKMVDSEPSSSYEGSYSGPPSFQTIRAGETFSRRECLHYWIRWQKRDSWPLAEGAYRLTITFNNSRFAAVSAREGELLHRWHAPPVEFVISGAPLIDSEELLTLVAQKARLRWLRTDLDSKNEDRGRPAWWAIHVWGDDRLASALRAHREDPYHFGPLPHYVDAPPLPPAR